MNTPVIFVIGPPAHGKSAARKILAELTSQKGESCSTVIYSFLAQRRNLPNIDALRQLPKEEIRPALIEAGDFMVGSIDKIAEPAVKEGVDDAIYHIPSVLIRTLYLSGYNIIDGVRRKAELEHARDHLDWNGVRSVTVWIEQTRGPVIPDNTDLTALDADVVVWNDGTLEELKGKLLQDVLVKFFGDQPQLEEKIPIHDSPLSAVKEVQDDLS